MTYISKDRISDQNVVDIMGTAAYGGITYWATEPTSADFAASPGEDVHVIRDGEEGEVHYLTPDQIRQAVVETAEGKHTNDTIKGYVVSAFDSWNAEDGIDCGDIDADAADCIVQVACFGEVVYG